MANTYLRKHDISRKRTPAHKGEQGEIEEEHPEPQPQGRSGTASVRKVGDQCGSYSCAHNHCMPSSGKITVWWIHAMVLELPDVPKECVNIPDLFSPWFKRGQGEAVSHWAG